MRCHTLALWAALGAPLALVGCAPNPADDAPAAVVSEPSVAAPADAEAGPADGQPAVDAAPAAVDAVADAPPAAAIPLSGSIGFVASKVTRTHDCSFASWKGSLDPGDGTPATATLRFTVDVASVGCDAADGGNVRLEKHLTGDDFFASGSHPVATFVSTSIVEGGEGGASHTISGDLTIRGITRQISFPAMVTVGDGTVSATAEFSVNRQDWEIRYPGQPDDLVRDNVLIKVALSGQA
mgnify:CR=1 FL=1